MNADAAPDDPAAARALRLEVARLQRELAAQRRDLDVLRATLDDQRQAATAEAWLREREQLLEDARRVKASRAWRYGHGVTRLLGRLTRRAQRTDGAVDVMIARLSSPPAALDLGGPAAIAAAALEAGGAQGHAVPARRVSARRRLTGSGLDRLAAAGPVTVVVPIHDAAEAVARCLESLVRHTGPRGRLVLVDDASTDPRIARLLAEHEPLANVTVVRNPVNLGFTRSVNLGLALAPGDAVVLNSDVEVGPRWLEQLVAAAYADPAVGTVTAVSNNAGAFSVPEIGVDNPLPAGLPIEGVARLVAQAAPRLAVRAPTGNGFCLLIKGECLAATGPFDAERFPRGYGEENDLCMRAGEQGWTHAIDDATWVFHRRGSSFGAEKAALAEAGRAAVDERHPAYTAQVRAFVGSDDLAELHETAAAILTPDAAARATVLPRVLLVLHEGGGGVPATNRDLMRGLADRFDCLCLTSDARTMRLWQWTGEDLGLVDEWPLRTPWRADEETREDVAAVARHVLTSYGIELVHVRHLFKQTLDVPRVAAALDLPCVISLHDFYLSCPTVHLLDEADRFCGGQCTPGPGPCRVPSPLLEDTPPLKHAFVHTWRDRIGPILRGADALVTTATHVADTYRRSYPGLPPDAFELIEHGRDLPAPAAPVRPPQPGEPLRVLVAGNLDVHKGADLIARVKALDAGDRLDFHFLGTVPDELRAAGTDHGPYAREEVLDRIADVGPAVAAVLSIVPETYSHALTEAWAAGVPVVATDLGAPAERIRRHGGGWLVPADDPEAVLRRLLELADDPDAVAAQAVAALRAGQARTVADMADDYAALYRRVQGGRRAVRWTGAGPLTEYAPTAVRLAALVPAHSGSPPASTHVRLLRRLSHPNVAWKVSGAVTRAGHPLPGDADVVLVQRHAAGPDRVDEVLEHVARTGARLVLELDDDLLALGTGHRDYGAALPALRRILAASDAVIVPNRRLAAALPDGPPAIVVPNMLDERLWFAPVPPAPPPAERPPRLLYMGTRTHDDDLELLRPVIAALRERVHPDLELCVLGGLDGAPPGDWLREVPVPRSAYPHFVPWLRSLAPEFDVAVAPLRDTPFNAAKSDLKLLDYGALGLASVHSAVPAYEDWTGGELSVGVPDDPAAWADALEELLREPGRRAELAERARAHVRAERCLDREGLRWTRAIARTVVSG